jgi:dihydrofolate reductase
MRKNMILIAAVDKNWGIGKDNKLLKRIPEDLKRFSEFTRGNIIIVGRKTLESFKDKKPLPDRINVVMTRDRNYTCEGAVIVHDLEELSNNIDCSAAKVYVAGGESIYKLLLPYCSKALITKIDGSFEADTHLVNLDEAFGYKKTYEGDWQESSAGVRFKYVDYERIPE